MFGFSKPQPQPENKPTIPVTTIPADFYAGANPTITFKQVEKVISPVPVMTVSDKQAFDKATAAGSGQPLHPATLLTSRKKLFIFGGGLFLVFIVGASAYIWSTSKTTAPTPPTPPAVAIQEPAPVIEPTPTPVTEIVATTTPTPPAPVVTEGKLEFPSMFLTRAADLDKDGLTDPEEELFGSDPGVPDTDADTYLDGSEVFHLYNPVGKEPIKLIDSNLVKEFSNPVFSYKLYYPTNWVFGAVDQNYRDVLFSTITGENMEIRVFDKPSDQTFLDWFAQEAPNEKFSDLIDFETRFGQKGLQRSDNVVYYFATPSRIYTLVFHTTNSTTVNYPAIAKMMARSFRLEGTPDTIQPPTPETRPAVTTTPEGDSAAIPL